MTDEELFAAYVAGDESGLAEIKNRYWEWLTRYVTLRLPSSLRGETTPARQIDRLVRGCRSLFLHLAPRSATIRLGAIHDGHCHLPKVQNQIQYP
jgi:hypothetical protein